MPVWPPCAGGGPGLVLVETPVSLALLQSLGPVSTFTFAIAVLPANARLLASEIEIVATLVAPLLIGASAQTQGAVDAPALGSILGPTDIFSGAPLKTVIGSNPYFSRGGQAIETKIDLNGDTFDQLTQGDLIYRLIYAVLP